MVVKQNVKKRLTQILCIALAALMVLGAVIIVLSSCAPASIATEVCSSVAESAKVVSISEESGVLNGIQLTCM